MEQNTQNTMPAFNKPEIYITDQDYDAISSLVSGGSPIAELLADEIDRALRIEPDNAKPFIRLGSLVQYRDLTTNQVKKVKLVLPKEADINDGRISILTPIGASLIGLTVGAHFQWTGNDRRTRELEILSVEF